MITVDAGSAVIGGRFDLATPDVAVDGGATGDLVVAHLTRGLNKRDPEKSGAALRIDGQVGITFDASGPPAGFEVAFLQFIRFNFVGLFFAGRKRSEGSIGALVHPALSRTVLLDPNPTMPPWMSEKTFTRAGNLAKNSMGDHPFLQTARQAPNFTTGVPNFIFHLIDDRDFWSVFSVRDAAGKFQHLTHFHWRVRHDVTFQWRGGVLSVARSASKFEADAQPAKGPPTEPALVSLLAAPVPPNANDELKAALPRALAKPPCPFRKDNPAWFPNVPGDFFR